MKKLTLSIIFIAVTNVYAGEGHGLLVGAQAQAVAQSQSKSQAQAQSKSIAEGGNAINQQTLNTIVQNNEASHPASSATAPSVFSANECMGSSSAAGQGLNFGLSFGTTWSDEDCKIFKAAAEFESAGYKADALVIRCQSKWAKLAPSCAAIAK